MKKSIKIILGVIIIIILSIIIDIICIFTINRPLFAIRTGNDGSYALVYKGLFYDTYNCLEYSIPQIKLKGTKFSCSTTRVDLGKVKQIVDTTKSIKDFACAEALEEFYQDDDYIYYYSCIKSKYVLVRYENGYEETVAKALKYGTITISDLDNYGIDYLKISKKSWFLIIDFY